MDTVSEETIELWERNGNRYIKSVLAMGYRGGLKVRSFHFFSRLPSWPARVTTSCHSSFKGNLMFSSGLFE